MTLCAGIDKLSVEILEACMDSTFTEIFDKPEDEVAETDFVIGGKTLINLIATSPSLMYAIRKQLDSMAGTDEPGTEHQRWMIGNWIDIFLYGWICRTSAEGAEQLERLMGDGSQGGIEGRE